MPLSNHPELELLLCCAASRSEHQDARLQEILQSPIDWTSVAQLAERHRVTPLVYRRLNQIAPGVLTRPAAQPIASRSFTIAARNLQLTKELLLLLDLFKAQSIEAISFKGPLLAISAFGGLAWREFGDLDLLLRPDDLPKARAILQARGYRPEIPMDAAQEAAYLRSEHAFQYIRDEDHLIVELHWRLEDRYLKFPFNARQIWDSVQTSRLFGRAVPALNPEILFLYLCMHGSKHYWERLEWIACLPAFLRSQPEMNWRFAIDLAHSLGGTRILHLGLLLAHRLDGTEATRAPLSLMKPDPIADDLAETVWSTLFTEELDSAHREIYRFRFYLKSRERLRDRLNIVRSATVRIPHPNSRVLESIPLPKSLLFLHYALGPIRRLKKYGVRELSGILSPKRISLCSFRLASQGGGD